MIDGCERNREEEILKGKTAFVLSYCFWSKVCILCLENITYGLRLCAVKPSFMKCVGFERLKYEDKQCCRIKNIAFKSWFNREVT
jgi:hypothetical protein